MIMRISSLLQDKPELIRPFENRLSRYSTRQCFTRCPTPLCSTRNGRNECAIVAAATFLASLAPFIAAVAAPVKPTVGFAAVSTFPLLVEWAKCLAKLGKNGVEARSAKSGQSQFRYDGHLLPSTYETLRRQSERLVCGPETHQGSCSNTNARPNPI